MIKKPTFTPSFFTIPLVIALHLQLSDNHYITHWLPLHFRIFTDNVK